MMRLLLFRSRMVLEMAAFASFLIGFFSENSLLINLGGVTLVLIDLISILAGTLRPGFPILIAMALAMFLEPWHYGIYWASAIFSIFDIPAYLWWLIRPPNITTTSPSRTVLASGTNQGAGFGYALSSLLMIAVACVSVFSLYAISTGSDRVLDVLSLPLSDRPENSTQLSDQPEPAPVAAGNSSNGLDSLQTEGELWQQRSFADGTLLMEYPITWIIDADALDHVNLLGALRVFTLHWGENATGEDINAIISLNGANPDEGKRFLDFVQYNISSTLAGDGEEILSIVGPDVQGINNFQALTVEVVLSQLDIQESVKTRLLLIFFDCVPHVCQVQYSRVGDTPFSAAERREVEKIISSITFVERSPK